MKHPSTRELYEYWNAQRGERSAPQRADIEPDAIRGALADTFILEFGAAAGHPFRLAGTRVCALFRRELKGYGFLTLWSPSNRDAMDALVGTVAEESIGLVAGAAIGDDSHEAGRLELVLLPLLCDGRGDVRLLGALAPLQPSPWPVQPALEQLTLRTHRFLGGTAATPRGKALAAPGGRFCRGLVVYDGGRDLASPRRDAPRG